MDSVIFLVDMQSFYASVEKALCPELREHPVVVTGDPDHRTGIVLTACPLAKSVGVLSGESLWKAEQMCPNLVAVRPRMELYLQTSLQIARILEQFSDLVEPYSIDEQFISIHGSEKLFGTPVEIAKKIQDAIFGKMNVFARIGMGPNKVLSKMACDNFAKKNKSGIFWLTNENIQEDLWPLPIENLFGVGKRMARHLRQMGIRTIGQLAHFPIERLQKRWGVSGHVLWLSANGIDTSPVTTGSFNKPKTIGHQMTLPRDYGTSEEIQVVLLELCEEVCSRVRSHHLLGQTISVGCRGANFHFPTGFYRQRKMPDPTNQTMVVFQHAWHLFMNYWDEQPIRSLGVTLTGLQPDDTVQLNLFELEQEERMKIGYVMDEIKQRFGSTSILRASSLTTAGLARNRAYQIGGHSQ